MRNIGKLRMATPGDREIVLSRDFKAPCALVFDALTIPAQIKQWFGGPPGWTLVTCESDPRVGGKYRFAWKGDGKEMALGGVYTEVVRPERFVATERFDEAWYPGEAITTNALTEKDGTTTLTLTIRYENKEARDTALQFPMEQGVAAGYDRLEEFLVPDLYTINP